MATVIPPAPLQLPDHTQLPDSDGRIVENFQEHPQGTLLTDTLRSVLQRRHPDGQYCIGYDSGIYWRATDPPLDGCKAPDWFYVPDVPPTLDGQIRRSYVLWQEHIRPDIILEFLSDDGRDERDQTPWKGKFWVYERVIRPGYYGIFDIHSGELEMYHLVADRFHRSPANERGHFLVSSLGAELGVWFGHYDNVEAHWLRWWDAKGKLLPTSDEREEKAQLIIARAGQAAAEALQAASDARQAASEAKQVARDAQLAESLARQGESAARQAESAARDEAALAQERADRLAAQLRAQGIEPEA